MVHTYRTVLWTLVTFILSIFLAYDNIAPSPEHGLWAPKKMHFRKEDELRYLYSFGYVLKTHWFSI